MARPGDCGVWIWCKENNNMWVNTPGFTFSWQLSPRADVLDIITSGNTWHGVSVSVSQNWSPAVSLSAMICTELIFTFSWSTRIGRQIKRRSWATLSKHNFSLESTNVLHWPEHYCIEHFHWRKVFFPPKPESTLVLGLVMIILTPSIINPAEQIALGISWVTLITQSEIAEKFWPADPRLHLLFQAKIDA